jgi:hypothetical protein
MLLYSNYTYFLIIISYNLRRVILMKKFTLLLSFVLIFSAGNIKTYSQGTGPYALLEYCTGTWCQWCPCGDNIAEAILNNHPNAVILAYHGGGGGDPFQTFNGNNILSLMGFNAYPTGVVGRQSGIVDRSTWSGWCNVVEYGNPPSITYNITKTYTSGTHQLQVTANVTSTRQIDTVCYINLVITEDNVIYNQTGNGSCPGSSTWVHKWIVRNMVNGATGESLGAASWPVNTMRTKSWTTTLDNAWVDANCNFAVFVYFQNGSLSNGSYVQQTFKNGVTTPVGVQNQQQVAKEYSLSQNYPNPFNPTTNIKFSLPKEGNASLKIYDITGSLVQTNFDGFMHAGTYNAEIDGSSLSSGVYFYTLKTNEFQQTKKMILVK